MMQKRCGVKFALYDSSPSDTFTDTEIKECGEEKKSWKVVKAG